MNRIRRRIGDWTAEDVREAGAQFRARIYAWEWPESILDLYDSPNARRDLRELRTTAQSTVDRMTRQAARDAAAGRMDDAQRWLTSAGTFWQGFETRVQTMLRMADETTLERTVRYVDEVQTDVADAARGVVTAATSAATAGAGIGIVVAILALVFMSGRR